MNSVNIYARGYQGAKKEKKSRKYLFRKILFAAAVIFSLSLIITVLFSIISFSESDSNFLKHQVKSGESLWSIASQYHEQNVDLRKIVYEIKKINEINSSVISPGSKLLIPLK